MSRLEGRESRLLLAQQLQMSGGGAQLQVGPRRPESRAPASELGDERLHAIGLVGQARQLDRQRQRRDHPWMPDTHRVQDRLRGHQVSGPDSQSPWEAASTPRT